MVRRVQEDCYRIEPHEFLIVRGNFITGPLGALGVVFCALGASVEAMGSDYSSPFWAIGLALVGATIISLLVSVKVRRRIKEKRRVVIDDFEAKTGLKFPTEEVDAELYNNQRIINRQDPRSLRIYSLDGNSSRRTVLKIKLNNEIVFVRDYLEAS